MTPGERTYQCDKCGRSYRDKRPPANVEAEFHLLFPNATEADERAQLCDVCFREFFEWFLTLTPADKARIEGR